MQGSNRQSGISAYSESEIKRFTTIAEDWATAAQHVIMSYVAIEAAGQSWLQWAIIQYMYDRVPALLLEPSTVAIGGITVGRKVFRLNDGNYDFDKIAYEGGIEVDGKTYVLPREERSSLNATFFPENLPQHQPSQARSPALVVSGGRAPNIDGRVLADIDHQLRSLDTPYDGLSDLLSEHLLPDTLLRRSETAIEILLQRPAETILADSTIHSGELVVKVLASPRINSALLRIGVKTMTDGKKATRSSKTGETVDWTPQADGLISAQFRQDVGDVPICQVFLSYAAHSISRWWIVDPTRLPTQRAAFLAQFDNNLTRLKEELLSRECRGHPFERILALALEDLGFNCMYLGEISHLQEAPDIYCETPTGRIAVIECAAVVTNSSEKLSKLQQRVLRIKESFAKQNLGHLEVVGVLVTKHSDAEIQPFLEEAARFGLGMVGFTALARIADALRFRSNPEHLYDQLLSVITPQSDGNLFDQAGSGFSTASPSNY
ncbi:hypothetical protein P3T18_003104 [Paraburkholderia sp. GAS199]|uniref:hypothetical protein n=1 Tax=Paraburkholderia sp. GAS199 TaxID=3035126 RepID=UPI003D20FD61